MTASKLLSGLPLAISLLLVACAPEPAAPGAEERAEATATAEAQTEDAQQAQQGAPKIASDAAVYEFGAIKATDSIEHIFKIKNEGDADLHIERVQRT